ncbi:MAG: SDR family oxidoreductase [Paenisporosarcina sp.]
MQVPLFTGFPGFIAQQIMNELIEQRKVNQMYALVLPSQMEHAKKLANSMMKQQNDLTISLIEGDITKPNLDINADEFEKIQQEINTVWHLAAIYDLAVPKEAAIRVNVQGTAMVNDFVRSLPQLRKYIYFSTAYVAGKREGLLKEDELIRPEAFKNFYEETKFDAEVLVEELKTDVPVTIIRPGIVRGHSKTGSTIKFDGPYFFINMIDRLKFLPYIPFVGKSKAYINVVPIDYVVQSVVYLSEREAANGKTIHLTDPSPHPVEEVYRHMVAQITGKQPMGRLPLALAKAGLNSKLLRKSLGVEKETLDYLTWGAQFDTTIATSLLKDSQIKCEDFIDTLPSMLSFYEKHKKDKQYHVVIK